MSKNYNKYYLKVGDEIVDLSKIDGFAGVENFVKLSIFTGLFKNQDELIECLVRLGLLSTVFTQHVEIVKRVGYKKEGYNFISVTEDIAYRRAVDLLSISSLKEFFYKNRLNYAAMRDIVIYHKDQILQLLSYLMAKLRTLQFQASKSTGEDLEDLYLEIEKRKTIIGYININVSNMEALLALIDKLSSESVPKKEEELNYIERIAEFVDREVYFFKDRIKYQNDRGLVRLALSASRVLNRYHDLISPLTTLSANVNRWNFLINIKRSIVENDSKRVTISVSEPEVVDVDVEPDSFMFLEEEDFAILESSSEAEKESQNDAIEGLRFKKRDYR